MKVIKLISALLALFSSDVMADSGSPITFFTIETFSYIDEGDTGPSMGDLRVGRGNLSSTLYGPSNGQSTWTATVVGILPDGQEQRDYSTEFTWGKDSIRVQKVINESKNTPSVRAITGGTGKYRNARGVALYEPLGDAKGTIKVTFNLR